MSRSPTAARVKAEQDKKQKQIDTLRKQRESYLKENIKSQLRTYMLSISAADQLDMAFSINRPLLVAEVLKEIAEEIQESATN